MLRTNLDVSNGLYNGARGQLLEIEWDGSPPVASTPAPTRSHFNEAALLRAPVQAVHNCPMPKAFWVAFHELPAGLTPVTQQKSINGRLAVRIQAATSAFQFASKKIERTQLPFIVSYAITAHKCQGLTINKVMADLGSSVFAAGMAYTVLSRVRRPEDIRLINSDNINIWCSKPAKKEYERLKQLPDGPPSEKNDFGAAIIPGQGSRRRKRKHNDEDTDVEQANVPPIDPVVSESHLETQFLQTALQLSTQVASQFSLVQPS